MPYETDPLVLEWFERTLADERAAVRCRAVEMLEYVACGPRTRWLARAQSDRNPRVAATAALVEAVLATQGEADVIELLESDAFEGMCGSDLEWEWEYAVRVCRGWWVPPTSVLVWTREEDDGLAKELAVMKMTAGQPVAEQVVPVIVGKRTVTRYTRSARSTSEARTWHRRGRPRYDATAEDW
jgi:hypothetical protein